MCRSMHRLTRSRSRSGGMASSSQLSPTFGLAGRQVPLLDLLFGDSNQLEVDLGVGSERAQFAFDVLSRVTTARVAVKERIDESRRNIDSSQGPHRKGRFKTAPDGAMRVLVAVTACSFHTVCLSLAHAGRRAPGRPISSSGIGQAFRSSSFEIQLIRC
jgi:hypothetical protein